MKVCYEGKSRPSVPSVPVQPAPVNAPRAPTGLQLTSNGYYDISTLTSIFAPPPPPSVASVHPANTGPSAAAGPSNARADLAAAAAASELMPAFLGRKITRIVVDYLIVKNAVVYTFKYTKLTIISDVTSKIVRCKVKKLLGNFSFNADYYPDW